MKDRTRHRLALIALVVVAGLSGCTDKRRVAAPGAPPHPANGPVITRSGLAIPVIGISVHQLRDSFGAPRDGAARGHNAIDIMAPEGTRVIAAAPGIVERLHLSRLGGITAYVRSLDGKWVYYYAHLKGYASGLKEGAHIRRGDPIGYVGHTGNATAAAPHLHFAVNRMAAGERWWQGAPVNPYPLLAGNASRR